MSIDVNDSPRERIVDDIVRGLYEGRYNPGQRLVEAKLTDHYGTSRGPVREALNRLSAMGVVELHPRKGGQVRTLTIDDALDMMIVVQGLMRVAGRYAATRIHLPGAADRLNEAYTNLIGFGASSSEPEYALARDQFYSVITDLSGNKELRRIVPSVQIHLVRVQFRKLTANLDRRRHTGYEKIVDAILSGDGNKAEKCMQSQFERTIKFLNTVREKEEQAAAS